MYDNVLSRYQRIDDKSRVLLIYLILNNYDLSKVEKAVIIEDDFQYNSKLQRRIGITNEYVDVEQINKELSEIIVPVIYSPSAFNDYIKAKYIYCYSAKDIEQELYINDLGVISQAMVIEKNCIISDRLAQPIENTENKGFMYFKDYVLNGECKIGNWTILYKDKNFRIYYTSKDNDGKENKELLYEGLELDITPTFKLVLYIIKKVAGTLETYTPDNYVYEKMKRRESFD